MEVLEENEWFVIWKEEGVLCYVFKKSNVDLEIAKLSVASRLRLTDNKPCKLYVDLSNVKTTSQEARSFYATEEAMYLAVCTATLAPSVLSKIIVTFFLNFNKPARPFKIFSNKVKAFEWLKTIKIEKTEPSFH